MTTHTARASSDEAHASLSHTADSTALPTAGVQIGPTVAGGSLLLLGSLGAAIEPGRSLNRDVRHTFNARRGGKTAGVASDVIEFLPLAGLIALEPMHMVAQHNMRQRITEGVTALAIAEIVVQPVKRIVRCRRPDGTDDHSFPSGHSAIAFSGAELCRQEYGMPCGIVAYSTAALTGWLRLRADRHWLTDVVAGAGIGILSAQAARLLLPFESRWLGINSSNGSSPYASSASQTRSLALVPFAMTDCAGVSGIIIF